MNNVLGKVKRCHQVGGKSIVTIVLDNELEKTFGKGVMVYFDNFENGESLSGLKYWPDHLEVDLLFDHLNINVNAGDSVSFVSVIESKK